MHVWNVLHAACWKYRMQTLRKNSYLCTTTQLCRAIPSQLRHVSTVRNKPVKQQYLLQMSLQYGELRPINRWDRLESLGHPSKFQRVSRLHFVTAATSLTGGLPNPNLARFGHLLGSYTIYTSSGALACWQNFSRCKIHFAFKSYVVQRWQCNCMAHEQRASAKICSVLQGMELQNFRRDCHLYSAGQPSHWVSAHILVYFFRQDAVLC